MDIRKIAAGASVAAIALGAVLPAAALSVGNGSGSTNGDLTGSVTTSVGVTGSGSSNTGSNTSGTAGVGVSGNGSVTGSNGTGTSGNSSISGNVHTSADAQANAGTGDALMITRADIDSNAVESSSWGTSRPASDVQSSADLKAYVASQMKSDSNLSAVEANSSDVAVTYKQRGRFLGFIPVTVKATAMVDQNGQVSLKYPWYTFLTATDRADLQAKLQASVDAMTKTSATTAGGSGTTPNANATANANANASFKLTADTQARIVAEMRRIMNEELNGSTSANAQANASASGSNY
ncbi:MAG: hypothetical protein JWM46_370 [Candidatus Kaiserbacteria bacterium]|nr:hypothetical protein [Candidatus Kaiserbacteria bacterium]